MNRARLLVLLSLVLILFIIAFFNDRKIPTADAARDFDVNVTNQPASGGRAITPAGSLLMDKTTRQVAVGALPMNFVRSPDAESADGRGRYLVAVCSGFGVQISAGLNRAMQSLMVIDLNARPAPVVVQNVYFQTPQSANVGAVFSTRIEADGSYPLYVSGGVENKIWVFKFTPGAPYPVSPAPLGVPRESEKINAPAIDVSGFDETTRRKNSEAKTEKAKTKANVYPTGLDASRISDTIYVANNLDDSLGIIANARDEKLRSLTRVDLRHENKREFIYPYMVAAMLANDDGSSAEDGRASAGKVHDKIYVSCWGIASVAVIDARSTHVQKFISVGRHPTAMIFNSKKTRLYVANSNGDSVSVIDTATDREIERINVRASEDTKLGSSPEGLALSDDDSTLYVANAHSNSVAVVKLSSDPTTRGATRNGAQSPPRLFSPSVLKGLIPTGQYPSAIAFADNTLFVANGKGTGVENSSVVVNNSGRFPNAPNERFPAGTGRGAGAGGEYSVAIVSGNISAISAPDERQLFAYTQQVMRNNHLLAEANAPLFKNGSPFKHIIYVIKENRTYDQIFGDLEKSGDGTPADGDKSLAIFGAGEAAQVARPRDAKMQPVAQHITPNAHALALRFGLLDRFFVNSEASPDGHNWSTAAFSTDYVDKAFRWNYSGRGRTYDFEGYNRLPTYSPKLAELNEALGGNLSKADAENLANYIRRFIPYLNDSRDVAEPDSLYLWDACARAGLSYRNYGEFVTTISQADVDAVNTGKSKTYPDTTPTLKTVPTKKTLEGHHHPTYRNFDLNTPDAMTVESYRAAKEASAHGATVDPFISSSNRDARFRATSRIGEWLAEFRAFVAERDAGRGDLLPALSIMRLPNDHTSGVSARKPTPQFYVADNDYALGLLVEAVSDSSYWKDTAIFVVEDDAQDGPDHVDAHRSPALVISAYNRPGALVHEFHNTVSLIRTIEMLLGLPPMNALDAAASPINIFRAEADLTPYKAVLPDVALDNLMTPARARSEEEARWIRRTAEQDLSRADLADARALNEAIWFSVKGSTARMPQVSHLPIYDAMRLGLRSAINEEQARTNASSSALRKRYEGDEDE
jgi:YVTN family beta-propeller protein